jgi:hypothetical protein
LRKNPLPLGEGVLGRVAAACVAKRLRCSLAWPARAARFVI